MSDKATADRPLLWEVPEIDGPAEAAQLTAGRLQEIQKEAYNEAWHKGLADGLRAGEDEIRVRAARLDDLLRALAKPFDELDEMVEKQLVELAMTVARQLFRREIKLDPTHIVGVVRDAIQLLPVASRNVQVHVHPDDAALIRESLSRSEGELAWTIVEDPLITRGGCNVTTENSQVDATAEARLQNAVAAIVGDERE